jgi:ribonuclease VapC
MFVDASALVAILAAEPDGDAIAQKLKSAKRRVSSPLAIYEAVLAISRLIRVSIEEAEEVVSDMMRRNSITVADISPEIGAGAIAAFAAYGKGRHKAGLNMGDCFAYACAKFHKVPILCKGNDFANTDIKVA